MYTCRRRTPQGGTCDVNGLLGSTGDTAISTLELRELNQGLSLEGHHHHITKKTPTEAFRAGPSAQVQRNQNRRHGNALTGTHKVGGPTHGQTQSHHMGPNFSRASIRSASTTASQRPRTCTTGLGEIRWESPSLSCNTHKHLSRTAVTVTSNALGSSGMKPSMTPTPSVYRQQLKST